MDNLVVNFLRASGGELPPGLEMEMYTTGAFLILKDFPEGYEFGVDYKSWTVGPKFMGLKMIPIGIHYIYVSVKGAPRIGFYHDFKSCEVVVKKWDPTKEDISEDVASDEEVERFRANLKGMDSRLDRYPFETYRAWYALNNFITPETLMRLHPLKGKISTQAVLVTMESQLMENEALNAYVKCSNIVDREHPERTRFIDQSGLPIMKIRPGYEIGFVEIPQMGVAGRVGIDYTDRLNDLLKQLDGDWEQLMAELQFAFTCFLIGQVFEGFEQWKRLIHFLCCCPSSLKPFSEQYKILMDVLFHQIKLCPTDFFIDIESRDTFFTTTLSMLFGNIRESDEAPMPLKKRTPMTLNKRALQFKEYLEKQFKRFICVWSDLESDEAPMPLKERAPMPLKKETPMTLKERALEFQEYLEKRFKWSFDCDR